MPWCSIERLTEPNCPLVGNFDQYMMTREENEENQMKKYKWEQEQVGAGAGGGGRTREWEQERVGPELSVTLVSWVGTYP